MKQSELDKYLNIKENWGSGYGGFNHAKSHYKFLKTIFDTSEVLTIADLGCGVGKFPLWVKENFPQHCIIGIDPVFVEVGKQKDVLFIKGDSTNIPLDKVDILTAFDVMEHVCEEDLERSFKEIARVTDCFIAKICTRASKAKGVKGEELHPTVQPMTWWIEQFKRYFTDVQIVDGLVICKKKTNTDISPVLVSLANNIETIKTSITNTLNALSALELRHIESAANMIVNGFKSGNKLLICGNGGSAADAQHIAAEFLGRFQKIDRIALPAIALNTNTSIITAIANDFGYKETFKRQVEAFGQKGDILLAISTSGNSRNVIEAVKTALEKGMHVISLTGETGGELANTSHITIKAPSLNTPIIQNVHISVAHIICELVEKAF